MAASLPSRANLSGFPFLFALFSFALVFPLGCIQFDSLPWDDLSLRSASHLYLLTTAIVLPLDYLTLFYVCKPATLAKRWALYFACWGTQAWGFLGAAGELLHMRLREEGVEGKALMAVDVLVTLLVWGIHIVGLVALIIRVTVLDEADIQKASLEEQEALRPDRESPM